MKNENNIQVEVEKTLNSLDTYTKRKAKPFMYTRIQEKLDQENAPATLSWFFDTPLLKPALATLILVINIFTVWKISVSNQSNLSSYDEDVIEMFSEEYAINQSSESDFNFYEE